MIWQTVKEKVVCLPDIVSIMLTEIYMMMKTLITVMKSFVLVMFLKEFFNSKYYDYEVNKSYIYRY